MKKTSVHKRQYQADTQLCAKRMVTAEQHDLDLYNELDRQPDSWFKFSQIPSPFTQIQPSR